MAKCPVCGGSGYHACSGLGADGAPEEPPEGWCEDCHYTWSGTPEDVEAYIDSTIRESLPEQRNTVAVWERVLAQFDKE